MVEQPTQVRLPNPSALDGCSNPLDTWVQGMACLSAGTHAAPLATESSLTLSPGASASGPAAPVAKAHLGSLVTAAGLQEWRHRSPERVRCRTAWKKREERPTAGLPELTQGPCGRPAGPELCPPAPPPKLAHLPRDGAGGCRSTTVQAEARSGAAGAEHLGGGGRLAACPLPPQQSWGEVSFIDLQVGPSLDCRRESLPR